MAEIKPFVYDLLNPDIGTLQKLSVTTFVIQLWRWKINEHRTNGTLNNFCPNYEVHWFALVELKKILPKIPPLISRLIEEYLRRFALSLDRWLHERAYSPDTFQVFHNDMKDILKLFDDFACDNNGTIHNVRTAKRMLLSDRISQAEKFNIACEYCLENDIRQIWSSISDPSGLNLTSKSGSVRSLENYWVCQIKNEHDRGGMRGFISYDETMLEGCPPHAWSSFQYFWHRLTSESQGRMISRMYEKRKHVFAKFILPMLNEQQLDKFANINGANFLLSLIKHKEEKYYFSSPYGDEDKRTCIFSAWMCIRDRIGEMNFMKMAEEMLDTETKEHTVKDALDDIDRRYSYQRNQRNTELETSCFCEIWSSAPYHWQVLATEHILPEKRLLNKYDSTPFDARETRFLVKLLSDATSETKTLFWDHNWRYLMTALRAQDLEQIMKLCFDNENKINQFKENAMSKYENIDRYCVVLFRKCCFKKLDSFLIFCCPETEKRKRLKQQFLKSNLLHRNYTNILFTEFNIYDHIHYTQAINEFIEDAFESIDLANKFKNQFVSLPSIQHSLVKFLPAGNFPELSTFVDTFALEDGIRAKLKQDFMKLLKTNLVNGIQWLVVAKQLQDFLVWCLGDPYEVIKFKQSLSPVAVAHNRARNKSHYCNEDSLHSSFDVFLEWYFNNGEEIQQFKTKYSEVIEKFIIVS